MADDKAARAPQDSSRIAFGEDYEVLYWTNHSGVSQERLEEAGGRQQRLPLPPI